MALASSPISVLWRSRNGEGELKTQRGVILPSDINYEIKMLGNSCLNLLRIRRKDENSQAFESPVDLSQEIAKKIFVGTLNLECHNGSITVNQNFYLHKKAHKAYLGPAINGVVYVTDKNEIGMAKMPFDGAILVKQNTPHYPLLKPSAPFFIITTPDSEGEEILVPGKATPEFLKSQFRSA